MINIRLAYDFAELTATELSETVFPDRVQEMIDELQYVIDCLEQLKEFNND